MRAYPNIIDKELRNIRRILRHLSPDASPKEVHALRRSLYCIEIAMDALGFPDTEQVRKARKRLLQLHGLMGKIRDLDVFLLATATMPATDKADRIKWLRKALKKKRRKRSEQMAQYVQKHRKAMRALQHALQKRTPRTHHTRADRLNAEISMSTYLQERISALTVTRRWNRKNLHAYRIILKQVLYAWKLSGARIDRRLVMELEKAKATIGRWHDGRALLGYAVELMAEAAPCRLLQVLRRHEQFTYRSALTATTTTQIAVARWNARPERPARAIAGSSRHAAI